jgi:hypothetical protein
MTYIPDSRYETVEVTVTFQKLILPNRKAILVDDGDKTVILPKSQIKSRFAPGERPSDGMIRPGCTIIVSMPRWLAEEKELI